MPFASGSARPISTTAAVKRRDTSVAELAAKLQVKPVTLYRYVWPKGELRTDGKRVLSA